VSRAWGRLPYELQLPMLRSRMSWAIGLYGGTDVTDLAPLRGVRNPVFTRYDVRDADAAFVADPFLFRWDDRWYLFFEFINWDTGLGEIGVASSVDARRWRYEGTALVEPHHLSYPLAFEADGVPHLVVESSTANVVRAYRAVDFPRRWEAAADLLADGPRVDPTIFAHDGRWWLFTGGRDDTHRWGRLDLHVASHPLGPYAPHPGNPVVYNQPRLARPAGRVIDDDGRILRFGQDCADDYGVRVYAAEIETLAPDAYAEKALLERPIVEPRGRGWNRAYMHHVDAHRMPDGTWLAAVDGW